MYHLYRLVYNSSAFQERTAFSIQNTIMHSLEVCDSLNIGGRVKISGVPGIYKKKLVYFKMCIFSSDTPEESLCCTQC